MVKTDNIYIKRARKKRAIKRTFILIILLIIGGVIFVTQTDVFKVDTIECTGENLVTSDFVMDKSQVLNGELIFTVNKKKVLEILSENPYIKSVEVIKKIPRKLVIDISEKKGLYYIDNGSGYSIISSDLLFLENVDSIEDKELIEIRGIDISQFKVGDKISDNERFTHILEEFYKEEQVIRKKNEEFSIVAVDLESLSNIKVYLDDILVRLGNDENIRNKMSNAINIYKTGVVTEYIDASFNGTPDFK